MTSVFELIAGSIVLGWLFHQVPATKKLERHLYLSYGFGLLFCAGSILLGLNFGGLWIATLEPFGVMLPALCLRSSARRVGWQDVDVPRIDLLVLAGLMTVVILGSFGLLPMFPYGLFYAGIGPGALAVTVALWALWRKQVVVLAAVVIAQVLWLLDVGSSNFYDHVAHLVLIPALVISALIPKR